MNVLGEIQKIESTSSAFNISYLASGIYFVTATCKDGKKRLSEKFVKK